jgi:hypothetical protein
MQFLFFIFLLLQAFVVSPCLGNKGKDHEKRFCSGVGGAADVAPMALLLPYLQSNSCLMLKAIILYFSLKVIR